MPNSGRRNSSQQSSEDYLEEKYVLPPNGLRNSFIIGIIGWIIALLVPVGIALLNTSQVAFLTAISGVCGIPIAGLLLAVVVGAAVGKFVVERESSFWIGFFVGTGIPLSYASSAFIPNYPGHISSGTTTISLGGALPGFGLDLFATLICALIGGWVSQRITRRTTRKHPYYHSQ